MNIQNSKSLVRHEVMNSLTILSYKANQERINNRDLKELQHHILKVSQLLIHEALLTGEKCKVFRHSFSLSKSLDYVMYRLTSELNKDLPQPPHTEITMQSNQQYMDEILYQFFKCGFQSDNIASIDTNDQRQEIMITKKRPRLCLPEKCSTEEILSLFDSDKEMFAFQIALLMAEKIQVDIDEDKKHVVLKCVSPTQ